MEEFPNKCKGKERERQSVASNNEYLTIPKETNKRGHHI